MTTPAELSPAPKKWQLILAYFLMYVVWGSSYLAIRYSVETIPPFLSGGLRFMTAGFVLLPLRLLQTRDLPTARGWLVAFVTSLLPFSVTYGLITTAETVIPSSIAALLLAIGLLFGGEFLGLGSDTIWAMVAGEESLPLGFAVKIAAMGITLAAGGCGGEITPTFFIGASSGLLFSMITGLDPSFCAALGVCAVLAASTNTPISGTLFAMELFGAQIAAFAGVACAVSYLVVGHRSLYPTQVRITGARTRFGSCSSQGHICFSWRLMQYPPEAIDYVVVHELAHLRYMNHGAEFYALIARYLPDWKARRALLRA